MTESILIVKKRGARTEIRVTKKMRKGYAPTDCTRTVNLSNYRDVCLFLHDLEDLFGAPVEKAVRLYLIEIQEGWPF